MAVAVSLEVDERVGNAERDLVPELRQRNVSPIIEDVGHRRDPSERSAAGRVTQAAGRPDVLRERLAEIADLGRAAGVLGWDQRVMMPPLGTEARAESLATLGRIVHEWFTDPEIGRLLDRLLPSRNRSPTTPTTPA